MESPFPLVVFLLYTRSSTLNFTPQISRGKGGGEKITPALSKVSRVNSFQPQQANSRLHVIPARLIIVLELGWNPTLIPELPPCSGTGIWTRGSSWKRLLSLYPPPFASSFKRCQNSHSELRTGFILGKPQEFCRTQRRQHPLCQEKWEQSTAQAAPRYGTHIPGGLFF